MYLFIFNGYRTGEDKRYVYGNNVRNGVGFVCIMRNCYWTKKQKRSLELKRGLSTESSLFALAGFSERIMSKTKTLKKTTEGQL